MDFSFQTELSPEVAKALSKMGYKTPTPIQSRVIPYALSGYDILGKAATGTGKTAAFGIPIVETIQRKGRLPQAIIMVPTRELATQVAEEIGKIGSTKGIKAAAIYGGVPVPRHIRLLSSGKARVIVGTPGRVRDLIERGALNLSNISIAVLDEVDRMLDMGFIEDIDFILSHTPTEKQTMFFSATVPDGVLDLVWDYLAEDYVYITVEDKSFTPTIKQKLYRAKGDRFWTLTKVLKSHMNGGRSIVFVNRKREASEVAERLAESGFNAGALHGDMSQRKRDEMMKNFRSGRVKVLVATDVAARGIDVKEVELVVNYRLPEDPDMYTHRIGRTARAGTQGTAVSIVSARDMGTLSRIRTLKKVSLERI